MLSQRADIQRHHERRTTAAMVLEGDLEEVLEQPVDLSSPRIHRGPETTTHMLRAVAAIQEAADTEEARMQAAEEDYLLARELPDKAVSGCRLVLGRRGDVDDPSFSCCTSSGRLRLEYLEFSVENICLCR